MPKARLLTGKKKKKLEPNCAECGLDKGCISPRMDYTGEGIKEVLVIAEAPGKNEDEQNKQLVGEAGYLFNSCLNEVGLDLHLDFWKINSVNCRPPQNRKPTPKELECCEPMWIKALKVLKPKLVVLAGGVAVKAWNRRREYDTKISTWRGKIFPDLKRNVWVAPIFHPSYILRNQTNDLLRSVFIRDLQNIAEHLENNPPLPNPVDFSNITLVSNLEQLRECMARIRSVKKVSGFDYETSALKPFLDSQCIWSVGIGTEDFAFAYPYSYRDYWDPDEFKEVQQLTRDYLRDKDLLKVCHNMKFEEIWSRKIIGVNPKGVIWCSMVNQHLLDPVGGTVGLKFQSFVRFGVDGYEREMKKYLGAPKGGNGKNKLNRMPLDRLLTYNAKDAMLTAKMFYSQQAEFVDANDLNTAQKLFHNSLKTLADLQMQGIHVDEDYYKEEDSRLGKSITESLMEVNKSPEAKKFKKKIGKAFNMASTKDLKVALFDIGGHTPTKETASGNPSVDVHVLHDINTDFTKSILKVRKLEKIKGTYLAQMIREMSNGRIHPFFDLHTARSGRGSSSLPNFQNIPARDKEAKASVRKGIVPKKGNKLLEVDFGSLEVRIIACYSRCPTLVAYINDTSTDMHRDQAIEIFKLDDFAKKSEEDKKLRFFAKNCFVFPEFYGSWYKACARELWENCANLKTSKGITVKKHLAKKGILGYDDFVNMSLKVRPKVLDKIQFYEDDEPEKEARDYLLREENIISFEEHIKKVENNFWKRFAAVKDWQERTIEGYKSKGYTESFFGFRRNGELSRNQIINTPIQGTAFHCLLWCLNRINRIRKTEKWKTKIIGQIHDSIILDLYPPEEETVIKTIKRVMEKDLKDAHDWMIVPMFAEIEMTGVDESWYNKKEVKL